MVTADDFLEAFAAPHDFEDQPAGLRMPFAFVDEIAFFEAHEHRLAVRGDGYTTLVVDLRSMRRFACRMLCNSA